MTHADVFSSATTTGNISPITVDEVVGSGRGYATGPERALLGALLFDGVQAFVAYALAKTPGEKARYAEAFNWVMDTNAEEPFSFNGTCEALGITPEYLRIGLANATTSLLTEVSKARRNF